MPKLLESHQIVVASHTDIWNLFQRLDEWGDWWQQCRRASTPNGDFTPGAVFCLQVRGLPAALRRTQIMELKPERFLAGLGQGRGIKAKQTWSFIPVEEGTQVILRLELWGWGLIPRLILGGMRRMKAVMDDGLLGLRREVESKVTPEPQLEVVIS
jgi:hypothetical protein